MADLAVLGLQIESDGAVKAANDLDKLSASATKAEKATDSVGKASEQSSMRMAAGSKAVERLLAAIEKVERAVREQNAALGNMGGAMARVEAQMEAASKAAQGVAASVGGAGAAAAKAATQVAAVGASGDSAAAGMAAASTSAVRLGRDLEAANQNARLANHQLTNLRSQAIDVGTMYFGGASIAQIVSTQAGQIYEAIAGQKSFKEGLQDLAGSARSAFSSIVSYLGPVGLGITGLTAAAAGLWLVFRKSVKPMADVLVDHRAKLKDLASGYRDLGDAMELAGRRSEAALTFDLRKSDAELQRAARRSIETNMLGNDATVGLTGIMKNNQRSLTLTGQPMPGVQLFEEVQAAVDKLNDELAEGTPNAIAFEEALAKIANQDPLNTTLQEIVEKLIAAGAEAAVAQRQIEGFARSIEELQRQEAEKVFKDSFEALRGMITSTETAESKIKRYAGAARDATRSEGDRLKVTMLEREALDDLAQAEERRRAGYELDVRAITAKSAAERAQIEFERTYADVLASTNDKAQATRQAEEARNLTLKQSAHEQAEAMEDRIRAGQAQVDQLQLEIDTFGKSAGEIARLTTETQLLTQAREAARQVGGVVDPAEEQAIRDQAAAIGALTDQMARLDLDRGQTEYMRRLEAEGLLIYANDDARRVALAGLEAESDLRRQGIPLNDAWGQTYVQNARDMAKLEVALDKQREAFTDLKDAAGDFFASLSSGKGILESFVSAFAQFGNKLAAQGFDKLFGGLFGAGGASKASPVGIAGVVANAASYIPTPTPRPVYQSPSYPYAEKYALPPIVTGEGFSASKAATVASQSVPARVWNFFAGKGLAAHQIAGIMGNGRAESAWNPAARGDGGAALGLFQWNDRGPAMQRFVGSDWRSDVNGQLEFAWKELQTSESKAYRALLQATNVTQATEAFLGFERPHGYNTGVRNSHNYSGRLGFAQDAYKQYGGTNVASSTSDARVIEKATANGTEKGYTRAVENYAAGRFDSSASSSGGLFGARGQAGMSVLGAGLGAFGSGYQSGSPLAGGLSGALGGYQAGGAISSFLGIGAGAGAALGVVGGAALGILGGILSAREKRKAEHKAAAEKWQSIQPQYAEFDRSITGEGQGQLREWLTSTMSQFDQFVAVGAKAWKSGAAAIIAQTTATGAKIWAEFDRRLTEFRDGYNDMIEDLTSGEGLGGAFSKGRAATKDLRKQIQGMIDDVSIAYGSDDIGQPVAGFYSENAKAWEEARNAAIEKAKKAAGEYALSLLYTAEVNSDVEKALDGFRGTAAGLQKVLEELGWTAEDAAADIKDRLNQAIAEMGKTFTDGFQRQINDLSGVGYLNDAADLFKARDTALNDAKLLGVDPEIVSRWFKLASQDLVNGSELVGSAFDDLIKAFPELSGVVHAFTGATRTAAEEAKAAQAAALASYEASKSQLESVYQTVLSYRDGIRSFLDSIKLDDKSTLSQADQVSEARRVYEETLAKANAGDKEAMGNLTGAAQDYLSEAKDYFASSADYAAIFESVNTSLKSADVKATSQLDLMRSQASWLEDISGSNIEIAKVLSDYVESQKKLNVNRSWGVMADQNKAIWNDLQTRGIDYTGNFGGGAFLDWVASQAPSMQAIIRPIIDKWSAVYAKKQLGGIVGYYADGGMVGNGTWNVDSVLARYAGGGHIGLAGGEFVMPAPRVTPQTLPMLEGMRMGRMVGNDNSVLVAELREANRLLRQQIATTGQGLAQNAQATERGNRSQEQMALTSTRRASLDRAAA